MTMTPAEKAKELVNEKYYQPLTRHLNVSNSSNTMWEYAKLCAMIAVDEIIEAHKPLRHYWKDDAIEPIEYWRQVRTEIIGL